MIGFVMCAVAFLATFEYGRAASDATVSSAEVGIVSIRAVFNGSQKHAQYKQKVLAAQSQSRAQLEDLARGIAAEEAELKTLRPGTADHLEQLQSLIEKRSKLESQQEYLKQRRQLEDKAWMEDLYQEVLKIVKDVATEKGLRLVLERTEPEFPVSGEELMMTFSTHKVLYDGGCMDLTPDVTARLDASENIRP